ncbi:MAG: glycosyl hydrolase, partial [Gemmatimonadetes bacterium]|nr:glycosyl hydrolase [Gemmatimonadota bacterium]
MPRLIIAREDELLVAKARDPEGEWETTSHLEMTLPVCVAIDPNRPANVYCGTFGSGLWRSDDGGSRWEWAGEGFPAARITAITVSSLEDSSAGGVVYAGTDPSAVYRSEDGGNSWRERTGLEELPSASEWKFPPRPE